MLYLTYIHIFMRCQHCKTTENLMINSRYRDKIQYLCRKCNTDRLQKYRKTEKGKENTFKAVYASTKRNPEKQSARYQVYYRLKIGDLVKPKRCEECLENKELFGHHTDYSKPLEVKWVCRNCHMAIHKSLKQ